MRIDSVSGSAVEFLLSVFPISAFRNKVVIEMAYGPDAYEFAKAKPLTLLNGGNLLHLLEKHGHKAKIDLKEAKLALTQEK